VAQTTLQPIWWQDSNPVNNPAGKQALCIAGFNLKTI